MIKSQLIIQSGSRVFDCAIEEGITWETQRKKSPGKLTFTIVKDEDLSFYEGDSVQFIYDGKKIFFGFVFTKKRSDLDTITVTCYDQLRYLKNKDTYVYENKTATQLLKMIINDFKLNYGSADDTKYRIPSMVEDNKELFEIMQNALDATLMNTGLIYVLYDDFGGLVLNNINDMKLDLLIDESSGETFEYTSSIDNNTYNKIKLVRENKKTGKREIFIAQDSSNINRWGVLQQTETLEENVNGKAKSSALLSLYNKKSRTLNVNGVFGDTRVRGGSGIGVQMHLGDLTVANYMIVETVKHTFKESEHTMDLRLIGGEFIA